MKKIAIILAGVLSLLAIMVFLDEWEYNRPLQEQIEKKLEPLILKVMKEEKIPGLALGLIKNNEIVYARGFGVKDIATGEPVTEQTLFHLASVSKSFVGIAIMQLVERGKIGLDHRGVEYLPYFTLADERYKEITIGQLLSHTSGMPDYDKRWINTNHYANPEYDESALERYVRSLSDRKMVAAPGEKYNYSNMAFNVLGDVIAKVSGQTFEDYMRENILDPLEMQQSTFLMTEVSPELAASPYVLINNKKLEKRKIYPYHRAHAPNGTLHANVFEMCNYALANLNRGKFNDLRILESSGYDLMWKPQKKIGWGEYTAHGWFLEDFFGYSFVTHSGGDLGFRAGIVLEPDKSFGLVILANRSDAPNIKISSPALKMLAKSRDLKTGDRR
jgi:CubicO group peptidase (beta-lactamase class C family)